jgi:hypothetical protein
MIKYTRFFILFLLALTASGAMAQSTTATTSSPYSQYGLGNYTPSLLPQNQAMGGIGAAINRIGGYNNINPLNPASYGLINYTVIDAGLYSTIDNLSQGSVKETNTNFRLSHLAFAIPVTKHSALSFGLLPYSELGYNYIVKKSNFGSTPTPTGSPKVDTNAVNYLYNGEGGLSKAYLGYGYRIGKHFMIGANLSYIFGNLTTFTATEVPSLYGFLNSKAAESNSVHGVNYDYGAQYSFDFGDTKHFVLGYSASANSSLNTTNTYLLTQYTYDSDGHQNIAADTITNRQSTKSKIQLPQINHFGLSYQDDGKFLIGADYTMGNWSSLTIAGQNAGLQNSKTINVGGQITPNINALRNYWARTDYRIGFMYDDTYINVNNTDIKSYAVTFGLGLPLAPTTTSFYKINVTGEIGQRGTLQNGLIKENYVNIRLGFTLNDRWFQRFRFD